MTSEIYKYVLPKSSPLALALRENIVQNLNIVKQEFNQNVEL